MSVRPSDAATQLEREGPGTIFNGPAYGEVRQNLPGHGAPAHEAFVGEPRLDNADILRTGRESGPCAAVWTVLMGRSDDQRIFRKALVYRRERPVIGVLTVHRSLLKRSFTCFGPFRHAMYGFGTVRIPVGHFVFESIRLGGRRATGHHFLEAGSPLKGIRIAGCQRPGNITEHLHQYSKSEEKYSSDGAETEQFTEHIF